jgi:hypothetical protein
MSIVLFAVGNALAEVSQNMVCFFLAVPINFTQPSPKNMIISAYSKLLFVLYTFTMFEMVTSCSKYIIVRSGNPKPITK